jgi:nicotinate phosphoribosyltransferase
VIEFGLRRAQGIDGALSAARAAFIGGCTGTSNVFAGKALSIPVKGTFAHSWVMVFRSEEESFDAYAEILPANCIFLVDTYDTVAGVHKAIKSAQKLRMKGVEMLGVRIDSGDLAHLSIEIRRLLDEAGFHAAKIMASNELDEYLIWDLKHQGAKIDLWGVGTHLVTAKDQSAFDGVYKLSAIRDDKGKWQHKLKLSEQLAKMTNPGILQVRRFESRGFYVADMIYDTLTGFAAPPRIVEPIDAGMVRTISNVDSFKDLLEPVLKQGELVKALPSLQAIQKYCKEQQAKFYPATRRFLNPQLYLAGLEKSLFDLKLKLVGEIQTREDA